MGAARRMSFSWRAHSCTMALVANVLPQPGPPVSTTRGAVLAFSTAAFCPSLSPAAFPATPLFQLTRQPKHLAVPTYIAPALLLLGSCLKRRKREERPGMRGAPEALCVFSHALDHFLKNSSLFSNVCSSCAAMRTSAAATRTCHAHPHQIRTRYGHPTSDLEENLCRMEHFHPLTCQCGVGGTSAWCMPAR